MLLTTHKLQEGGGGEALPPHMQEGSVGGGVEGSVEEGVEEGGGEEPARAKIAP